jgi:hypothetical protein
MSSLEEIEHELYDLKQQCAKAGVSPMPWKSKDHPLSLKHWALVQERGDLETSKNFSDEQRAAAGARLRAARAKRTS